LRLVPESGVADALDAGASVAASGWRDIRAPGIRGAGGGSLDADLAPVKPRSRAAYAHELYACLREFDALGCDLILVVAPPVDEAWRAVNDRLLRAAAEAK
jgi:hypothetical protein